MAPDDASVCSELPSPTFKRMANVWSSNSLSSMVSDSIEEDREVEFELDIEVDPQEPTKAKVTDKQVAEDLSVVLARSQPNLEMSHGQVPRSRDMEGIYNSRKDNGAPTTMMVRNIPGRYTQQDFRMDLKDLGFAGTYDFLYMPVDRGTAANVGYAFVNFIDSSWAAACMQAFDNFCFSRHHRSSKMARVSVAHLQGLEKNLEHYQNAAVNMSKEKRRRPVVFASIAKMIE